MSAKRTILSALLAFLLLASCDKKDASEVLIWVTQPSGFVQSVPAGSQQVYHVSASAVKGSLRSITVSSWTSSEGNIVLLDTAVDGTTADFDFVTTIPDNLTNNKIPYNLTFEAFNTNGVSSKMELKLTITSGNILPSHDGIFLYSALSGKPNGIWLDSVQTIYCETAPTNHIDIYDYYDTLSTDSTVLSRCWRSQTNIDFTKFNGFNFAGATAQSLSNAYNSATHLSEVKELQAGDIILIGRNGAAVGVIQVVDIVDEEGCLNDRYILNIKKK